MIKELANFEEASHRVLATEATLLSTLTFAPSSSDPSPPVRYARTFILSVGEKVAGMALYFNNYSTWLATPGIYLEDLYVRQDFRRKGYAGLLLERLAQEASEISGGIGRLEWSCLKWNKNALDFYEKIGGERMEEWIGIRVEGERLRKLAGSGGSGVVEEAKKAKETIT